jgi:hypothetical protein
MSGVFGTGLRQVLSNEKDQGIKSELKKRAVDKSSA